MKKCQKITGILLTLILVINLSYLPNAIALEAEDCEVPDYEELIKVWEEAESKDQDAYMEAFEAAQEAYHDYVGCLFDIAERKILGSDGAEQDGTMSANMLNTGGLPGFGDIIDLMSPTQACLDPEDLKKIIKSTDPKDMLTTLLDAHTTYSEHLQDLGTRYSAAGGVTDSSGKMLEGISSLKRKAAQFDTIKRRRKLEIETSLMAIDMMFTSLKELRLAFVMHVHFQCTLKYLDKYRRRLEDLRDVIEPLPDQLENASSS